MARCAGHGEITVMSSGTCASRSLVWRGAPVKQGGKEIFWKLRVAHK
ncbi:hypothetical protein A2U01_0088039, partial [Trifolium medium]|nr:hypothetical protein [Trifolium medium]